MSGAERLTDVLALFTLKRPAWTPLAAARTLGISRASAYRYFAILLKSGFISDAPGHQYVLGPRIIELDRQIRLSDPLLQAAVDEMAALAKATGGVALLCRLIDWRVLCIHQERGLAPPGFVSYERGRGLSLYWGATSKVILAQLHAHELEMLVKRDRSQLASAGLPRDSTVLHEHLKSIREQRICIAYGEVDPGACGLAVPISHHARVIGSLSIVLRAADADAKGRLLKNASRLLTQAGLRIESDLEHGETRSASKENSTKRKR